MSANWITACAVSQYEGSLQLLPQTAGATIRTGMTIGLAGEAFRIMLGEKYSHAPICYSKIVIAVDDTQVQVTFDGAKEIIINPGDVLLSDPIRLSVRSGDILTLWLYNGGSTISTSICCLPQQHSAPGDFCGQDFPALPYAPHLPTGMEAVENLAGVVGVQVATSADAATIAAFGDSITKMDYWVSPLRKKIHSVSQNRALVNCGIGGNRLLRDTHFPMVPNWQMFGVAGLTRMQWDLLAHPGVKAVVLALGINDITQPGASPFSPPMAERCTAEALIQGYRQFVKTAHMAGIKVIGCTITPFGGYATFSEETEAIRLASNEWIQSSGCFDFTVDFAAAICNPYCPTHILAEYDSGDGLHPGPEGGLAMANAVDVQALLSLSS